MYLPYFPLLVHCTQILKRLFSINVIRGFCRFFCRHPNFYYICHENFLHEIWVSTYCHNVAVGDVLHYSQVAGDIVLQRLSWQRMGFRQWQHQANRPPAAQRMRSRKQIAGIRRQFGWTEDLSQSFSSQCKHFRD